MKHRLPILWTVALALLQSGCATVSSHGNYPSTYRADRPNTVRVTRPNQPVVHEVTPEDQTVAELVVLQTAGLPRVHVSMVNHSGLDPTSFTHIPSLSSAPIRAENAIGATILEHGIPLEGIRWIAFERAIWSEAYRQGHIRHESIGRGFQDGRDGELSQHAIRQTVGLQLGSVHCSAHRKFYQEAAQTKPSEVDRYVAAYRRKHRIPLRAPFGIEVDRLRDQVYLRFESQVRGSHRVSLHRTHAIMGHRADSELVESSLICMGVPVDTGDLGTLSIKNLAESTRIAARFVPVSDLKVFPRHTVNVGHHHPQETETPLPSWP